MPRVAVLSNEQVFMLRNDVLNVPLKHYSQEFGVSVPTLIKAKKGRKPYHEQFTKEFEDAMVQKYFNR